MYIISNMSKIALTVGDVDGTKVVSVGDLEGDLGGLEVGMAVVGLELGWPWWGLS